MDEYLKREFEEYESRFERNGVASADNALMGVLGQEIMWSSGSPEASLLEPLFDSTGVRSIVSITPAEPYRSIIEYLAAGSDGVIRPQDCETRLFLVDLPVLEDLSSSRLEEILKHRKSAVAPGGRVVACSSESLKKAFVTASSVCFACFVKFFGDMLEARKSGAYTAEQKKSLRSITDMLPQPSVFEQRISKGPFSSEEDIYKAVCEAGRKIVELGLVDSCFGNVSYSAGSLLYISRTGSFLDSLEEDITVCSREGTGKHPADASSELPAHLEILRKNDCRAIVHGHPKFSVILSMDCSIKDCPYRGKCHLYCPYERHVCGSIPVVSGEVGGGRYGLCNTVPDAMRGKTGAIVYGHGVFACDASDFNGAVARLAEIENRCCAEYFRRMGL